MPPLVQDGTNGGSERGGGAGIDHPFARGWYNSAITSGISLQSTSLGNATRTKDLSRSIPGIMNLEICASILNKTKVFLLKLIEHISKLISENFRVTYGIGVDLSPQRTG